MASMLDTRYRRIRAIGYLTRDRGKDSTRNGELQGGGVGEEGRGGGGWEGLTFLTSESLGQFPLNQIQGV